MKVKQKNPFYAQQGQAMVETLVASLAIVPFFVVLPYMGKLLDIKFASGASARYGVSEKYVHLDGKTNTTIQHEVQHRVQSEPGTRIKTTHTDRATRNRFWQGRDGTSLVDTGDVSLTFSSRQADISRSALDGLRGIGPFGIDLPFDVTLLDVNTESLVTATSSLSVEHLPLIRQKGLDTEIGKTGSGGEVLTVSTRLALLTDTFAPESEEQYVELVQGLSINEIVWGVVFPGCVLWAGGGEYASYSPFPEAEDCNETDLVTESAVVLDKYLDHKNARAKQP